MKGREAGVHRALEAIASQPHLDGYWVVLRVGAVFGRFVCQATCQVGDIPVDSALGWISYALPYRLRQAVDFGAGTKLS